MTQIGDLKIPLDVVRGLDGVVKILEKKGQSCSRYKTHDNGQEDVEPFPGFHRILRHFRPINDPDVSCPHVFGQRCLLKTLDQQFIHMPGAFRLALEDRVLDRLLVKLE